MASYKSMTLEQESKFIKKKRKKKEQESKTLIIIYLFSFQEIYNPHCEYIKLHFLFSYKGEMDTNLNFPT